MKSEKDRLKQAVFFMGNTMEARVNIPASTFKHYIVSWFNAVWLLIFVQRA
ncbi:hypothetical protein [Actinobacillus suis]|uniref:Uncharacterized protein n=1 Tax=Actinobacillus suis TaxID=716 RepID=A0ABT1WTT1_ACTSU|nr:hypothetical protein [Actinobacillus suis]EFM95261.1 hypothetical protein appser10_21210 [Actinobacillus pleuropneumoniae serovar 10 str. D13039]MCO4167108.1 hypothetical protein [Actinobacillus suis]MCO4169231.1 hypothetical protein [Actinobacillus suis]MCQ9629835.1 hypothetical protein [Actinobacillus suis]MCQ9632221.1 hypothetical protein [Actinobacillus suis]